MPSTKAVLFDLDGTLLSTLTDIAESANQTLMEAGYPVHPQLLYREYVGDGLTNLARKVLPEGKRSGEHVDRFVARYREVYSLNWARTSVPFPGIVEMLQALVARGLKLGVLSNKRDDFTKLCVERLLPGIQFDVVRGELAGTPLKPDPTALNEIMRQLGLRVEECIYVGDSEIDVETAQRAGVRCIAVTWGFRDRPDLESAGAHEFVADAAQLVQLVCA